MLGGTVQQMQICVEARMSIQAERQKTHALHGSVSCLLCDGPMTIKTIEPSMLVPSLDEMVSRCLACQLERKQSVIPKKTDWCCAATGPTPTRAALSSVVCEMTLLG